MRQAKPEKISKPFSNKDLCKVMNLEVSQLGIDLSPPQSNLMPEIWSTGLQDILLPVKSLDVLKHLNPNMIALSDFSKMLDVVGVHAFTIYDGEIWVGGQSLVIIEGEIIIANDSNT